MAESGKTVIAFTGAGEARQRLAALVDRIVRLEDEKKAIADDIRDVYGEGKGEGFEVKAVRRIVRIKRMDQSQRAAHDEVDSIFETYMRALGML